MGGPGSIHHVHSDYSRPSDHLDSKAADRTRKAQPEQRSTSSAWPESGDTGGAGRFNPVALAHKAARFFGRLEAAANRETHSIDHGFPASRRPGTAHSVIEGAGAAANLFGAASNAYEAAKPLISIAKAGKAVPPQALIIVVVGMLPELRASWKEFREASRDLKDAVENYKRPKETISASQKRE